jgi:Ca2+-binding RTX toxin-like protein
LNRTSQQTVFQPSREHANWQSVFNASQRLLINAMTRCCNLNGWELAMPLDAQEQYLLELINRARLDPSAELARYNAAVATGAYSGALLASLNDGLAPNAIGTAALQPLAANENLNNAAVGHSQHMLTVDLFDHQGIGDGDIETRATAAGYNSTLLGENISWSGTTGSVNQLQAIEGHQFGLFRSAGHRSNLHNSQFTEIGLARELGQMTAKGTVYNASMLTEMFGVRGAQFYLTGVVYNDSNANRFYTPGEGYSAAIGISGVGAATSSTVGGYSIVASSGVQQVSLGTAIVSVIFSGQNIKLDLVNGNQVQSSASVTAVSGVSTLELLGNAHLTATGAAGAQTLIGNVGNNSLYGMAGNDYLFGKDGADILQGGDGSDHLWGGTGADQHIGGNDAGVDYARYDDAFWGNLSLRLDAPALNSGAAAVGDTYVGIEGLVAGAGNDVMIGNAAANFLFGGSGIDFIDGQGGNDYLNGGAGTDRFRFSTTLGAGNVDTIADFTHGSDDILLRTTIFNSIGATLDTTELRFGTAAIDANDYLIYNSATGQVFYDANGSASGGMTLFATVVAGTVLDSNDFQIV